MSVRAFIALGSNLGDPVVQVTRALDALAVLPESRLMEVAPFYQNVALGPDPQPEFINCVAEIDTTLTPHALLDAIQSTEASMGRVRNDIRWSPRLIDLDLLIYGDLELQDDRLTLPHPEICARRFVLQPLNDIAPDLIIPGHGPVGRVLSKAPAHEMRRISAAEYARKAG